MIGIEMLFSLLDQDGRTVFGQAGLVWDEEDDSTLNVGLGYRHLIADDSALIGINMFYDYQSELDLQRYSVGLELKSRVLDLYANWYDGLGSETLSDGRTAYSPDGFDIEALGRLPALPWVELSGKYYAWDMRVANSDSDLKGQKYALRIRPVPLLTLEGQYDSPERGGEDWGMEAKIKYRFGVSMNEQLRPFRVQAEDPRHRRFEQVRREYRQRVAYANRQSSGGTAVTLLNIAISNGRLNVAQTSGDGSNLEARLPENYLDPIAVVITAQRDGDYLQRRTVDMTLSLNSSAVRGRDYIRVRDGTVSCAFATADNSDIFNLVFEAAGPSDADPAATAGTGTARVTLCLRDNSEEDATRTIDMTVRAASGYRAGAADKVTLYIIDDEVGDIRPRISFRGPDAGVSETVANSGIDIG